VTAPYDYFRINEPLLC